MAPREGQPPCKMTASTTDNERAAVEPGPAPATAASLRGPATRSSVATLAGAVASNVLRLATNAVLTRLLLPEDFGLMGYVYLVLAGLALFADIGIAPSLIQSARGEERPFLHTAFSLQAIRGFALALAAAAFAAPAAEFYNAPALIWLIPLVGITSVFDGFTSTKLILANRRLQLWRVVIIDLGSQVVATAVAIGIALASPTIYALLAAALVRSAARCIASHVLLEGQRDGFAWEREARQELIRFGRWIFLSTAMGFLAMNLDRIVLGKLLTKEAWGVYSVLIVFATAPREIFGRLSQRVLFPVVAQLFRDGAAMSGIRKIRTRILAALVVPMALLAGESLALIDVIYDERYRAAGPLLAALAGGIWFSFLSNTYGVVHLAAGRPKWIFLGSAAKAIVFLGLVYPAFELAGVLGVASLFSLSELAVAAVIGFGCRRYEVLTPRYDLVLTLAFVALSIVVGLLQHLTVQAWGSHWPGLCLIGGACALVSWTMLLRSGLVPGTR